MCKVEYPCFFNSNPNYNHYGGEINNWESQMVGTTSTSINFMNRCIVYNDGEETEFKFLFVARFLTTSRNACLLKCRTQRKRAG